MDVLRTQRETRLRMLEVLKRCETGVLYRRKGGPIIDNHRDLRKVVPNMGGVVGKGREDECPISYLRGMVSKKGEGMAGHHARYTLGVIDEASGVDPVVLDMMEKWASRLLIFGNPNPVPHNHFFRRMVREGNVVAV